MIYSVIACMGGGKTLFSTNYAIDYESKNPNSSIIANYSLIGFKNFTFTQFGFLPFSKLEKSLIIIDDISAVKNQISGLLQVIANSSRKLDLDIILTAQYYTMIPRSVRELSKLVIVQYDKKSDILFLKVQKSVGHSEAMEFTKHYVRNAVENAKDRYNTNEIVSFATDKDIVNEIIKISEDKEDIAKNIEFFTQSETKRKKYRKLVALHLANQ